MCSTPLGWMPDKLRMDERSTFDVRRSIFNAEFRILGSTESCPERSRTGCQPVHLGSLPRCGSVQGRFQLACCRQAVGDCRFTTANPSCCGLAACAHQISAVMRRGNLLA